MTENEFLLEDRKAKIKSVIEKYGEENFYISFSGGKDSTVLSALVDITLPKNKIPRVYANTGIEYRLILKFVEEEREREHPWELIILKPTVPIKLTLENEGYPFKSKMHSKLLSIYQRNGKTKTYYNYLGLTDKWGKKLLCPNILRYQFTDDFKIKVSDKCCLRLKENPIAKWSKGNNKPYAITGIMPAEGGRRQSANCLSFRNGKFNFFQPLVPLTKEWEDWFIHEYSVKICDIYKPPYNFTRTGCKGCPFALHLQEELDTLEKFFPNERKQCEYIWKPIYVEYRRLGYRLRKDETIEGQMNINDFLGGAND